MFEAYISLWFLLLTRILISVSQKLVSGKGVSSDGFEKCVSLWIVDEYQVSSVAQCGTWNTNHSPGQLNCFTDVYCAVGHIFPVLLQKEGTVELGLIEEITWDWAGFWKIHNGWGKAVFGKLPLSFWPDPWSISHLRPTAITYLLPEFLTLYFMIILVVFVHSPAMETQISLKHGIYQSSLWVLPPYDIWTNLLFQHEEQF